jgi:F420-dependent oxidoreductase-like protein
VRIGLNIDGGTRFGDLLAKVRRAQDLGYATAWLSQSPGGGPRTRSSRGTRHQVFGYDPLTTHAICAQVCAQHPGELELGTNILATFPRHPMVLAEQVLTVAAAHAGGLAVGLGVSHRHAVEDQWGYAYARTALHMREYLQVLRELLATGAVSFTGDTITARGSLTIPIAPGAPPIALLVAALGPRMLQIAGELGDGAITWMTGRRTLAEHIRPSLDAAATAAGRPASRLVAMIPVCITSDTEAARERARRLYLVYRTLPNYRAVLDREGAQDAGDIAIVGDEEEVARCLADLAEAGVTDMCTMVFGSPEEVEQTTGRLPTLAGSHPGEPSHKTPSLHVRMDQL